MNGKFFRTTARAIAAATFGIAWIAASAQTFTSGTLTPPANGLRWGQDTLAYIGTGTCSGSSVDFRHITMTSPAPLGNVPVVTLKDAQGYTRGGGSYPATAPCVGGTYQVNVAISLAWQVTFGLLYPPGGMLPGPYVLHGATGYPPDGPNPAQPLFDTPAISATVRFDHPFQIAELNTGLTPIGGSARYVDPMFAPVPLPPGMVSPQLIEVSNASEVALSLPFNVADATLWIYDQLPSLPRQWRAVRSTDGQTYLSGNTAIVPTFSNPSYIGFSYTRQVTVPPVTPRADMWWGGQDESGWGLSIGRNGDDLFVAGFLYDYGGKPTWGVMQNGQWDSSHTTWLADVYIPNGSPLDRYDASKLNMGSRAGVASLRFRDATHATFQYRDGYTHEVQRFTFGADPNGPYHGYWWGGATQAGWGLHLANQGDALFATWYTYGADGMPTWLYMPGATKVSATHFTGNLYRTTGGSWPTEARYDPGATVVTLAGTLDLAFSSDSAGTMTAVVDGKTITVPIQRFGF